MITVQQQAAKMTRGAVGILFRTARHLSEDKRGEGGVVGQARSVNSQLTECMGAPHFFLSMLGGAEDSADSGERERQQAETRALLADLDAAEAVATESYGKWCAFIEALPEDKLEEMHTLPFAEGMTVSTADLIFTPYFNMVYHIGQINYLQMQLGDTQMHW